MNDALKLYFSDLEDFFEETEKKATHPLVDVELIHKNWIAFQLWRIACALEKANGD